MIFAFTHATSDDPRDWRADTHRYVNPPKAKARHLSWMVNWMKEKGHMDYKLWCNGGEFFGWIDYDYARCLLATGKKIIGQAEFRLWLAANPR